MSLTKQMTAVRVLMDIEAGKFTLTTPIREIIPEFGIKGKQNITVGHVLTHRTGLNTEIPFTLPVDKLGNIEAVVACLSNERILFMPGAIVTYNPTTAHALAAAMVQRLDAKKRPFRRILAEDIFAPLGMKDTALGLPDRLKKWRRAGASCATSASPTWSSHRSWIDGNSREMRRSILGSPAPGPGFPCRHRGDASGRKRN